MVDLRVTDLMVEPRVNILLIEDAEPDVFLVREALKNAGLDFELSVLDDGEKAIDFIDELDRFRGSICPTWFCWI
jgi:hypothetical protein